MCQSTQRQILHLPLAVTPKKSFGALRQPETSELYCFKLGKCLTTASLRVTLHRQIWPQTSENSSWKEIFKGVQLKFPLPKSEISELNLS